MLRNSWRDSQGDLELSGDRGTLINMSLTYIAANGTIQNLNIFNYNLCCTIFITFSFKLRGKKIVGGAKVFNAMSCMIQHNVT